MNNKAFEVGIDIMKAQPCPVCGGIGAEVSAGCPKQAPAIMCPIRRKETRRSRHSELSRIGGQNDSAPMSLEDMRNEFIINNSDDKDWYEDASRDKELDSKRNDDKTWGEKPDPHKKPMLNNVVSPKTSPYKEGPSQEFGRSFNPHKYGDKNPMLNNVVSPKKASSLIDRARKANKEDPRPGSANYSKKGNE